MMLLIIPSAKNTKPDKPLASSPGTAFLKMNAAPCLPIPNKLRIPKRKPLTSIQKAEPYKIPAK